MTDIRKELIEVLDENIYTYANVYGIVYSNRRWIDELADAILKRWHLEYHRFAVHTPNSRTCDACRVGEGNCVTCEQPESTND